MTTDPSYPIRRRGLSRLDWAILTVTVLALAAPFAARWFNQAEASGPKFAVLAEVSSIRPIDYALGYEEQRAEAAFFEGLEQPPALSAGTVLDVALAAPATGEQTRAPVLQPVIYATPPRPVDISPQIVIDEPEAPIETLALAASDNDRDDPAFADDLEAAMVGARPAQVERIAIPDLEPEPVIVRVVMSAPPTMTPLPSMRPRANDSEEIAVASVGGLAGLRDGDRQLPIDVTPPLQSALTSVVIDEAPLAPLTPSVPKVEAVASLAQPRPSAPARIEKPAPVTADADESSPPPPADGPKITNGPRIALVIAAAGLNTNVTRFAIEALPAGVTLAFAPVKPEARTLAQAAKDDGHTVLVEIPMEPINKSRDPGPMTLRVSDPVGQNLKRLDDALARIPMADGASSYLGARFNSVEGAAGPVMTALAKRDLFFFENEPTARSLFQRLAQRSKVPYARGVVKIDRSRDGASIRAALDALEKQARATGSAVGVGTTLRGTISTVAIWAKEAEKRGVRFVPVTELGK